MAEPEAPPAGCPLCSTAWCDCNERCLCPMCKAVMCDQCAYHPSGCPVCWGDTSMIVIGKVPVPGTKEP